MYMCVCDKTIAVYTYNKGITQATQHYYIRFPF